MPAPAALDTAGSPFFSGSGVHHGQARWSRSGARRQYGRPAGRRLRLGSAGSGGIATDLDANDQRLSGAAPRSPCGAARPGVVLAHEKETQEVVMVGLPKPGDI